MMCPTMVRQVEGNDRMQLNSCDENARRDRDRERRRRDQALRLEVENRMARLRRLQVIVGRALAESGLEEEFEAAMRA